MNLIESKFKVICKSKPKVKVNWNQLKVNWNQLKVTSNQLNDRDPQ